MTVVQDFVTEIIKRSQYQEMDRVYLVNRLFHLVGETSLESTSEKSLLELKEALVDQAIQNGKIEDSGAEREMLGAELMNFITPIPSQVNQNFWSTYQSSPEQAILDFYQLSQDNDVIKQEAIAKNIAYKVPTDFGDLEITINLSKPEKDPKDIAKAKTMTSSSYPTCLLCVENEGYQGRIDHPARANHRLIRLDLNGEEWGFQYSPYAYFTEHSIVLDTRHRPMVITPETFSQLLDLVDIFPGYFVGSNADLPIVGGSILSHNHYQAGRHIFPMEKAELLQEFTFEGYSEVRAGILNWPMSVIRLQASDKTTLCTLAEKVMAVWKDYSDLSLDILAYTGDQPHHTITPIARKKGNLYELDLVLRDNHTSESYPDGVFHPHQDVQHIKKENIGLIEVMGLAILPPRLKDEILEVEKYLLDEYNAIKDYHKDWADSLKAKYPTCDVATVSAIVKQEIGYRFLRVLEDAGVYKMDAEGQAGFVRLLKQMGAIFRR